MQCLYVDCFLSVQGHSEAIMFLDWSLDGCFLQSLSTDYEHIVCKYVTIKAHDCYIIATSHKKLLLFKLGFEG